MMSIHRSIIRRDIEVSVVFPQSLQANVGEAERLGHDNLLPNPFKFISHRTI
jgi:hypothetical protein